MIAWIKRLFGIKRADSAQHTFAHQYGNKAGGDIVGRDLVVVAGKGYGGRSIAAEVVGKQVVLSIQPPQKQSKKAKKQSREARRKAKAARNG